MDIISILKKAATMSLCVSTFLPSFADALTESEAMGIAKRFLDTHGEQLKKNVPGKITPATSLALAAKGNPLRATDAPAYYVFNISDNGGYVITSGDTRFTDVLAYDSATKFDETTIPDGLRFWLDCITREMDNASRLASPRASSAPTKSDLVVEPLLHSKWGQGNPYNQLCKVGSMGGYYNAPTGCVATAMAQIMNYHQWPKAVSDFEFNWDLMLPAYNGSESEEEILQVATLMKKSGDAVHMNYGSSESTAHSSYIPNALVSEFGYDGSSITFHQRNTLGYEAITKLLHSELQAQRPVYVAGSYPSQNIGHAFVLDGCQGDYYHINWGWDGYCDGYFRLTSLCPEDFGIGGSAPGFSHEVEIITGITPDRNLSEPTFKYEITATGDLYVSHYSEDGTYPDIFEIELESEYNPKGRFIIRNGSYNGFISTGSGFLANSVAMATMVKDLDTGEEKILYEYYDDDSHKGLYPGYYLSEFKFRLPSFESWTGLSGYDNPDKRQEWMSTTHRFEIRPLLAIWNDNNSDITTENYDYYPVKFYEGRRSSVVVEMTGRNVKYIHEPLPVLAKADFGDVPQSFVAGTSAISVPVSFTGLTEGNYVGNAELRLFDANGEWIPFFTEYAMLDMCGNESISTEFKIYEPSRIPTGDYTMAVYDFRSNRISEERKVSFTEFKVNIDETEFPDAAFRQFVKDNFDADGNGSLSLSEIENVFSIQIQDPAITDVTGIKHFTNAVYLVILESGCKEFNLNFDNELWSVYINNSPLQSIDLSKAGKLNNLLLYSTELTSIDLSECSQLQNLYINKAQIKSVDLTDCHNLAVISLCDTPLNDLNLSSMPELNDLIVASADLEGSFDISAFPQLRYLNLCGNNLSEIIIGNNSVLEELQINSNAIEGTFDISGLPALTNFDASCNRLSKLIIGNHPMMYRLWCENNVIEGDLDLSGYEKLNVLNISDNRFSGLTLGTHPDMQTLYLSNNAIEGTLDISGCESLMTLHASNNKIDRLEYGSHPMLEDIIIDGNRLSHFNAEDFDGLDYYSVLRNVARCEADEMTLDLSPLVAKGFDISRANNWVCFNLDEEINPDEQFDLPYYRGIEISPVGSIIDIPQEVRNKNVVIRYQYQTDSEYNPLFTLVAHRESVPEFSPAIEYMVLDQDHINLLVGETINVNAWIEPVDADAENIWYQFSEEGIATAERVGLLDFEITGIAEGETYFAVIDPETGITATTLVTVTEDAGVDSICADDLGISVENDSIVIESNSIVRVYTIAGFQIFEGSNGRLDNLQPGIYIANGNGRSLKINIR